MAGETAASAVAAAPEPSPAPLPFLEKVSAAAAGGGVAVTSCGTRGCRSSGICWPLGDGRLVLSMEGLFEACWPAERTRGFEVMLMGRTGLCGAWTVRCSLWEGAKCAG